MTESRNRDLFLVRFLSEHPSGDQSFIETTDHYVRYVQIETHLNSEIHPFVNQGATASDKGWLTDHGPDHISKVIRRASELVEGNSFGSCFLTPYESFVLLLAIQFHDVGNVFGRDKHEKKIAEVMRTLPFGLMPENAFEKQLIRDIARAHGGYFDTEETDRDTIGPLIKWDDDNHVRTQLLAAILRFADELADDYTRTNRFLINNKIPVKSQVFHMYADRLRHVKIDPNNKEIRLIFELRPDDATKKYGKGRKKVFLFDEILDRCAKMHREHTYCQKFFQKHILIDSINVSIDVLSPDGMESIEKISFRMRQGGYPSNASSIQQICGNLAFSDGKALSTQVAGKLSVES